MRSRRPQLASAALRSAIRQSAPATPLAAVQTVWLEAVGAAVSERARPVAEKEGVVAVSCDTATWAQELDLMQEEVRSKLNAALARSSGDSEFRVLGLRFSADGARHAN